MRRWCLGALLILLGCDRPRMSSADCTLVLDRIVELELRERGFRDPLLAERRQRELRVRFQSELRGCEGRRAPTDVAACVKAARNAEELSHRCLR